MTVSNEFIVELLKNIQADLTATKSDVAATRIELGKQIAVLADGMLSLRRDVQSLANGVDVLTISTAGHAERLADVEHCLERIQHTLEAPPT